MRLWCHILEDMAVNSISMANQFAMGYKLWVGTTRQGYVNWFEPYQGASTDISIKYKELGELPSEEKSGISTLTNTAEEQWTN